ESVLVSDPARPTTRKVRFVSEHFSTHMLRADWERAAPASADIEQKLIDAVGKAGKRVIVDPKSPNFAIYRGATLLTPNRKEFAEATRSRADSDQSIAEAAR